MIHAMLALAFGGAVVTASALRVQTQWGPVEGHLSSEAAAQAVRADSAIFRRLKPRQVFLAPANEQACNRLRRRIIHKER
jgi:hypothetical protein